MDSETLPKIGQDEALRLIRGTVFDSVGCTEPAAIAYAATAAYAHVGGSEVKRVTCTVSVSVFKNAMAVGIPGSDRSGIDFAVALGIVAGDWQRGLELFARVKPEDIEEAAAWADSGVVGIELYQGADKFYIHTQVETEKGTAEALIRGSHDNLEWITLDGKTVWPVGSAMRLEEEEGSGDGSAHEKRSEERSEKRSEEQLLALLRDCDARELIELADAIPEEELGFLTEGVDINIRAAEYGLSRGPGMGLGRSLAEISGKEGQGASAAEEVQQYVAAAVDTRMSGALIPIKGCGGSGNHGITFFLTLGLSYRREQESAVKSLARTLAFGLLMVRYIKGYTGLLSPTCGVTVSAAPAAAAALLYARGGGAGEVAAAVKLIEGNLAGILCDGAKQGCALKASTSGRTAVDTYKLVEKGVRIPDTDGIVGVDLRQSMNHLQELQEKGLRDADRTMLNILLRKSGS